MEVKLWSDHSIQTQQQILNNLSELYKELGNPDWLHKPNITQQIINQLKDGTQVKQEFFRIEGISSDKDLIKEVK